MDEVEEFGGIVKVTYEPVEEEGVGVANQTLEGRIQALEVLQDQWEERFQDLESHVKEIMTALVRLRDHE